MFGGADMAKRVAAIAVVLALCALMTGCTIVAYFGGWATSGGTVVDNATDESLVGVTVEYRAVSDESFSRTYQTDKNGSWRTNALKLDLYRVTFTLGDYEAFTTTLEVDERGGYFPLSIRMLKSGD
jgi:predicted small secreted protein